MEGTTKGKYVYEFKVGVGYVGADRTESFDVRIDYDEDAWDALTDEDRESYLYEQLGAWAEDQIETAWS